ncbi:hypothetical protein KQI84_00805 [bacterium]|nr:hypothetical protein [bacterium]
MKKFLIGCLAAGLLFVVLIAGIVGFLFFRILPTVSTSIDVPGRVQLDAEFPMVVSATNPHTQAVTLSSIDVDNELLDGFQVISIDPAPQSSMQVMFLDQRSWVFNRSLEPGESIDVTFILLPVREGRFQGSIDTCNPNQDFVSQWVDVIVRRERSAPPPAH